MHKLWFTAGLIILFLPTPGVSQTPAGAPDRRLPWVTSEV
jgi:hypothetical protein